MQHLGCQPRAVLLASVMGIPAAVVHVVVWDRVWTTARVGSSELRDACQVHPGPDPPKAVAQQISSVPVWET